MCIYEWICVCKCGVYGGIGLLGVRVIGVCEVFNMGV